VSLSELMGHPAVLPQSSLFVAAAAIKREDGSVWYVEPPERHHHVIQKMVKALNWKQGDPRVTLNSAQGFLLSDGSFVNRTRAKVVAIKAKQLLPRANADRIELFSEDVW
jgi:hypothetical protein